MNLRGSSYWFSLIFINWTYSKSGFWENDTVFLETFWLFDDLSDFEITVTEKYDILSMHESDSIIVPKHSKHNWNIHVQYSI